MGVGKSIAMIGVGVASGLSVAWLYHVHENGPKKPDREPAEVADTSAKNGAGQWLVEAKKPATLEPPSGPAKEVHVPAPVPPPQDPSLRHSVEAQAAKERAAFKQALISHDQEPRDGNWAPITEHAIQSTFGSLGDTVRARFEGVDCRSESCVATLRWGGHAEALVDMDRVVTYSGDGTNCGRYMVLDDAPEGASYTGKMYFDCGSRFNGQEQTGKN